MKLLFLACSKCGAPSTSAFGLCAECESREAGLPTAPVRRIREQVRAKRAA